MKARLLKLSAGIEILFKVMLVFVLESIVDNCASCTRTSYRAKEVLSDY